MMNNFKKWLDELKQQESEQELARKIAEEVVRQIKKYNADVNPPERK